MIDLPRHMLELQIQGLKERLQGFESGATYSQPDVQRMCEQAAARGRAEVRQAMLDLLSALTDLFDEIDESMDIVDGRDGPNPNWAMRLGTAYGDRIAAAVAKARSGS